MSLRVAFCNRADCLRRPGGDTVQMLQTKALLEARHGVRVDVVLDPAQLHPETVDLVHVFNLQGIDQTLAFVRRARAAGVPVVISSIFWDLSHGVLVSSRFGRRLPLTAARAVKPFYDAAKRFACRLDGKVSFHSAAYRDKVAEAVEHAALVLPNSEEEARCLERFLGRPLPSWVAVTNALDVTLFRPASPMERQRTVVCAARVEPVKNQLGLLRAMKSEPDVEVLLVGAPGADAGYVQEVRRALRHGNGRWVDCHVSPVELRDIYAGCRVHALPSFRESPGLSSLESLSTGCTLVVSDRPYCPVDTYFADLLDRHVFLCDPYRPASIRRAVLKALEAPAPPAVGECFSWRRAAEQTFAAYRAAAGAARDDATALRA